MEMSIQNTRRIRRYLIGGAFAILMLAACGRPPEHCPPPGRIDLSDAEAYATDNNLSFRFPLNDHAVYTVAAPFSTGFAARGVAKRGLIVRQEYHAAEDTLKPTGTPVYAMADGMVSFSGPMGGYGWLVIVDHPQANLYSLYGHLSPSRWQIDRGPVSKGEILGYLGDPDENGGSAKNPLRPHLHFGVRGGQRADYPSSGAWRWQAGWIRPCPQDRGWLQPSLVIANQEIPAGGFPGPAGGFLARWWVEGLFAGIYVMGGVSTSIYATRKDKPFILIISSLFLVAAGWILSHGGWRISPVLFVMAVASGGLGLYWMTRRRRD
jgi:hypothetical protein